MPEFKYLNEVKIISGFYEGQVGTIIETNECGGYKMNLYPYDTRPSIWVDEDKLELTVIEKPKKEIKDNPTTKDFRMDPT